MTIWCAARGRPARTKRVWAADVTGNFVTGARTGVCSNYQSPFKSVHVRSCPFHSVQAGRGINLRHLHCRNAALYLNIVPQVENHNLGIIMKFRMLLTLLLCSAGLALAAGEKKSESPSEAFMKVVEASRNLDYGALANLSCGEEKAKMQKYAEIFALAKKRAADGDKGMQLKLDKISASFKNWQVEIAGEKIDGNFAAVYYVSNGTPYEKGDCGMARFKKVGGEWKLVAESEYMKERAFAVGTGTTAGDTPSQVVAKLSEALGNCDIDAIPGLCYGTEKVRVLNAADRFSMLSYAAKKGNSKARKDLKKFMEALRPLKFEIRGETIDGDLAVVDVVLNGGPYEAKNASEPQYLKKIGGEWKIVGKATYDKEKAARKDH